MRLLIGGDTGNYLEGLKWDGEGQLMFENLRLLHQRIKWLCTAVAIIA